MISSSVGAGAADRHDDVLAVQGGLNRLDPAHGQPAPLLKLDGICGPKTLAAIRRFQKEECGFHWPDGRIDPGRRTLQHLNEQIATASAVAPAAKTAGRAGASGSADLPFNPYVRPWMLHLLPIALRAIQCAQEQLSLAWPVIDHKDVSASAVGVRRAAAVARVNLHFEVKELWGSHQAVVDRLLQVYRTMSFLFIRPGNLWGKYVFEDDPFPRRHRSDYAYTFCGGFYMSGEHHPRPYRQRLDSVYLCEQLAGADRTTAIITIVHELAHFVGSPVPAREIGDFNTYGWVTEPQMKRLPADLKIRHAETFANFAVDSLPSAPSGT